MASRKEIQLGQYAFDDKYNVFMVVDFSNTKVKLMKVAPRKDGDSYPSYSVDMKQLVKAENNIWEVKL